MIFSNLDISIPKIDFSSEKWHTVCHGYAMGIPQKCIFSYQKCKNEYFTAQRELMSNRNSSISTTLKFPSPLTMRFIVVNPGKIFSLLAKN